MTTEPFVLADYDGDGDLDGVREGAVFENFGDACFALRHRLRGFQAGLIVTAGDVDGDGYADLVELGRLEVYATIHYGDGRFGFPTSHGPFPLSHDWRPLQPLGATAESRRRDLRRRRKRSRVQHVRRADARRSRQRR